MRVEVDGDRLFVEVVGAKLVPDGESMRELPTIVVVHGGPGVDHSVFRPELDALADFAQLVYYDQRGNGRSDGDDPARWNIASWADDVRALCEALELERPIVLGASLGGIVALAYAARHPDHPARLILLSTSARMRLDAVLDAFERLGGARARDVARRRHEDPTDENLAEYLRVCFPLYTRSDGDPHRLARAVCRDDVRAHFSRTEWATFDLRRELVKIACPALVLAGEEDPITPPVCAREIAALLRNARFELVAGAGHGLLTDAHEAVLELVREFVAPIESLARASTNR